MSSTRTQLLFHLNAKRISILYDQCPIWMIGSLLSATILLWIFLEHAPGLPLILWYGGIVLVTLLHYLLTLNYRHRRREKRDTTYWQYAFVSINALTGVIWASALPLWIPSGSIIHQGFLCLWLAGLSAATIAIFSAVLSAFFAFSYCALLPVAGFLFLQGTPDSRTMAMSLLLYVLFITFTAYKSQKILNNLLNLQVDNLALADHLKREKNTIEKLKQQFNEDISKRQQTEIELRADKKRAEHMANNLRRLSFADGLTGIGNRRQFDTFLEEEWSRCLRDHVPIAMIFCDIDHFKHYNDHHGHQAGDQCIVRIAKLLQSYARRPGDLAARYGGEEFALLFSHLEIGQAKELAEKIRQDVVSLNVPHSVSPSVKCVTVSLGVISMVPTNDIPSSMLTALADSALYQAKQSGRNKVVSIDPSTTTDLPSASLNGQTHA